MKVSVFSGTILNNETG